MWERACSRRQSISRHQWRLTHHFREQARSHKVMLFTQDLVLQAHIGIFQLTRISWLYTILCGSGLAREGGLAVDQVSRMYPVKRSQPRCTRQLLQGGLATRPVGGLPRMLLIFLPPRDAAHGHGWPIAAGPRSRH
ncbi:hypothetical protein C1X65_22080 [Pseudomonas sp. FW305-70]|nr:hypothetical protein C1X65_22080 [Pseudomonas sp. FW305-70]